MRSGLHSTQRKLAGTKQAAEKISRGARSVRARLYRLRKNSSGEQEVSGHDFSRADKVRKMSRALAPANPSLSEFAFHSDFFRSHFSRAETATKSMWPSGPAGRSFGCSSSVPHFSAASQAPNSSWQLTPRVNSRSDTKLFAERVFPRPGGRRYSLSTYGFRLTLAALPFYCSGWWSDHTIGDG
jgi:hypothetical protein